MASAASLAASLTSPAASCTAPLALSALPSLCRSLSPLSLPAPSLIVPLALSATRLHVLAIHNVLLLSIWMRPQRTRKFSVPNSAIEQSQSAEWVSYAATKLTKTMSVLGGYLSGAVAPRWQSKPNGTLRWRKDVPPLAMTSATCSF